VERAGRWLLQSGIIDPDGGVARYRLTDSQQNLPASTEITGYTVSGLCYLYELTADPRYLAAARLSGDYLTHKAWDESSSAMPFEIHHGPRYSYFFDCGIIIRALLWLYRLTSHAPYLERARSIGIAMERDFASLSGFHPIVLLPSKSPEKHDLWWSRMPGAFQLKAALGWLDLGDTLDDQHFRDLYDQVLAFSLEHYAETLDNESEQLRKMDRLHAWSYFLEGLQPVGDRQPIQMLIRSALAHGEQLREQLAPIFLRSDVCAQLLRIRLIAGLAPAPGEIIRIESFQYASADPTLDGGFGFGRRDGALTPHVNPVSTVFCLQALSFAAGNGSPSVDWRKLI
jgi:hypothetical protein